MDRVREKWERLFRRPEKREQHHDLTSVESDVLDRYEGQSCERNSHGVENWGRLVRAILNREELRITNIHAILQAADEIQPEDLRASLILCEEAYSMALVLDPSSKGIGILLFRTGLKAVIKQKIYKRNGARINRDDNIEHLCEFYQRYKRQHRVDDLRKDEQKGREAGSSCFNLRELELRYSEVRKVIANLRALVIVIEVLSNDKDPHGVGRIIPEEACLIQHWSTMDKAYDNWERLVRATLKSMQLRNAGQGEGRIFSEVSGAISPLLRRITKIEEILQAVDEIRSEDLKVTRILSEQAYNLTQALDRNNGFGALMFKTGITAVIQQQLSKRDGCPIDRKGDLEHLWEFYKRYNEQHRVADLLREEEQWGPNGQFPLWLELRRSEMVKVISTSRVLVEVLEALSNEAADCSGVGKFGKLINDEVNWLRRGERDEPLEQGMEKLSVNEDDRSSKPSIYVVEETKNTNEGADRKLGISTDEKITAGTTPNGLSTGSISTGTLIGVGGFGRTNVQMESTQITINVNLNSYPVDALVEEILSLLGRQTENLGTS